MKEKTLLVLFVTVALFAGAEFGAGARECHNPLVHAEVSADRSQGVVFVGPGGSLGDSVSAAGDFNADGFADFAIADGTQASNAGAVYIVFGRNASAWASAVFDFSIVDDESWIRIGGFVDIGHLGSNSIAHGDFNGDGVSDVLIGESSGAMAYCVYGRAGAWSSFNTADLGGTVAGFSINGSTGVKAGAYTGNAGDLNGDGIEDLLITAVANDNSFCTPAVVFGTPGAARENVFLSSLNGTNGFTMVPESVFAGRSTMGSAGDVNGDGLADLVIGDYSAQSSGRAYVVQAKNVSQSGSWGASITLAALDGSDGFIVTPDSIVNLGSVAMGAGDLNGDGFADIYVGSRAMSSKCGWVVFGHAGPWSSHISEFSVDGSNGFLFVSSGYFGLAGARAGDVDGDGFDDLILGGYIAMNFAGTMQTGAAVVIYGHNGSWPSEIARSDVVGSIGFQIDGVSSSSYFGLSVDGAGDANGDGIADILIGGPEYLSSGYVLLVFGSSDHCTLCSNTSDLCLVCDTGYAHNGSVCDLAPPQQSSSFLSSSSGPTSSSLPSSSSSLSSSVPSGSSLPSSFLFSSSGPTSYSLQSSSSVSTSAPEHSSVSNSASARRIAVIVIIEFFDENVEETELLREIEQLLGIENIISIVNIGAGMFEVGLVSNEMAETLVDAVEMCMHQQ